MSQESPILHRITRRVQFAETDLAGVVHFAECFRYFEEVEHDLFRVLGIPLHPVVAGGSGEGYEGGELFGWPRVAAQCQYHRPLRFPEVVEVRITAMEVSSRAVRFGFEIVREEEVAVVGSMTVACVEMGLGGAWRSRVLPEFVRAKLLNVKEKCAGGGELA